MAFSFTLDDVAFLRSEAGATTLASAAGLALDDASLIGDLTRLRALAGERAAAVAETVVLRRRARRRWGPGPFEAWLFTDEALQQASPPPVAAHRARRIAALAVAGDYRAVHDLTCSIGTDVAALAASGQVIAIGSDLDPVRLAMAQVNLLTAAVPQLLFCADARTVTSRDAIRYADPARRDGTGRRITSADTIPSVAELDAADRALPPVLRLPPGIDYEALMRPGEIELVSFGGTVREAVSWPRWAGSGVTRRATVLRSAGTGGRRDSEQGGERHGGQYTWQYGGQYSEQYGRQYSDQYTDADPEAEEITAPRRYLIDPDPAVVRAHLVRQYAARHGLTRLDEHLAYLTGDAAPAGVRGFEILHAAPLNEKTIRDWAKRDGTGSLEIKQRGTPVIPDELRRRLKLHGDTRRERTLIVARIGRAHRAFWCRSVAA